MSDDLTYLMDVETNTLIQVSKERLQAEFQKWAAKLSVVLETMITVIDPDEIDSAGYAGFTVKETETHRIEVHRMLVNWRLARVPKGQVMPIPDRFWCYDGLGPVSLFTAVMSALVWDGADDTRPEGWSRDGQTGETSVR